MKIVFSFIIFVSIIWMPVFCFAQKNNDLLDPMRLEEQTKNETEYKNTRVKFAPTKKRDPFLSKEEVVSIERARRQELERAEKERKARENAILAAREAERARVAREEYLKANPHLAIVHRIKIQGMMGDEVQINNDFKAVGDQVAGGAVITRITNARIFFKYKGKEFSLPIPKQKNN